MTLFSINPATEREIARFIEDAPDQVESKIAAAAAAFQSWRRTSFDERRALMFRASEHIRANYDRYSHTLAEETGKPIVQAGREVDRFAGRCDYFAANTEAMLAPERVPIAGLESWIRYEPLGVTLGVMPWNFPFGQASRWAVPALMAGNTALLKHASNVTMSAYLIQEAFEAAGFPLGVFACLFVSHKRLQPIVTDRRIVAVSLTGSTAAGVSIGAMAGGGLKKLVLELGGSDPLIVLEDANVEAAAAAAARGRFLNNSGQACTAAKRFIVVKQVAQAFSECLVEETKKLRVGDPLVETTDIGPLAKADALADLNRQYEATLSAGARVAFRSVIDDGPGYYFPPTVLTGVTPDMVAAREETFGPLATVLEVPDAESAMRVANESEYGLGASLWTADLERASLLAADLEVGMVAINSLVVADPRLPFGGVKRSGFGREMSAHGVRELTNIKTVNVGSSEAPLYSR